MAPKRYRTHTLNQILKFDATTSSTRLDWLFKCINEEKNECIRETACHVVDSIASHSSGRQYLSQNIKPILGSLSKNVRNSVVETLLVSSLQRCSRSRALCVELEASCWEICANVRLVFECVRARRVFEREAREYHFTYHSETCHHTHNQNDQVLRRNLSSKTMESRRSVSYILAFMLHMLSSSSFEKCVCESDEEMMDNILRVVTSTKMEMSVRLNAASVLYVVFWQFYCENITLYSSSILSNTTQVRATTRCSNSCVQSRESLEQTSGV